MQRSGRFGLVVNAITTAQGTLKIAGWQGFTMSFVRTVGSGKSSRNRRR